ncbi:MAG: hypothetical protein ACRD0P_19580 [Stackebrandtia sp.]
MSLPWVRLDTGFPHNPKVLMLAEDKKWQAITVYIGGLAYSGAHGTDGFLPQSCLPYIHSTRKQANELVIVGLWMPCAGGWEINGWREFQPTSEENETRRKRARAAAEARWGRRDDR